MHSKPHRVLVIIPAFNEGVMIGELVRQIRALDLGIPSQVLVIDDGSADNTAEEARKAGARTVSLIQNLGYGFALQTGYHVAVEEAFDIVLQMDGDGQHPPACIPSLLDLLLKEECDVVIGSRGLADVPYPMPFARRAGQKFFGWLLFVMSGLRIHDPTSGFQAFNSRVVKMLTTDDFPGDYPDTNVLLYLNLHGFKIREVPAAFRTNPRGTSMHSGIVRPAYYIYKMLFSMAIVRWRLKRTTPRKGDA